MATPAALALTHDVATACLELLKASAPDPLLPGGGHFDHLYPASLQGLLLRLPLWSRASLKVQRLVRTQALAVTTVADNVNITDVHADANLTLSLSLL